MKKFLIGLLVLLVGFVFLSFLRYGLDHASGFPEVRVIPIFAAVATVTVMCPAYGVFQIIMSLFAWNARRRARNKENYGWLRPDSISNPH